MRVLIATDAFPPVCGGSGWSTYELAKGLRARGHHVTIVRPRVNAPEGHEGSEYDGFQPIEPRFYAPPLPYLRNYFKNERLYPRLETFLANLIRRESFDVVHAQHLLSSPPSVAAARSAGVPAVCTIRDYWPVCYWSDLILDRTDDTLCPGCTAARMTRCVRPHAGPAWPVALPFIPYMRANLSLKRRSLAGADALIAVSRTIAADLRARAPEIANTRLETIPNPVDIGSIRTRASSAVPPLREPYALYVGKLEPNKGVTKLIVAIGRAKLDWPLVVVGDGSERPRLEALSRQSGRTVRFTGWLPREEALSWLKHAAVLVFPSHGPESLSRVLLEASALGVPIAAMDTGGTADIVRDEETGLLSRTAEELGEDLARLRGDAALRTRLGDAARQRAAREFDSPTVIDRIERLYGELLGRHAN